MLAAEMDKFKNENLTAGPTSFTPSLHVSVTRPMAILKTTNGKTKLVKYAAAKKPTF